MLQSKKVFFEIPCFAHTESVPSELFLIYFREDFLVGLLMLPFDDDDEPKTNDFCNREKYNR